MNAAQRRAHRLFWLLAAPVLLGVAAALFLLGPGPARAAGPAGDPRGGLPIGGAP